jgi:hypothetical protein
MKKTGFIGAGIVALVGCGSSATAQSSAAIDQQSDLSAVIR